MRIVNNIIFIVIILSVLGMTSCNEEKLEVLPFHLDKKSYEVMLMGWNDIPITNGSGILSVTTEDKEIVSVSCITLGNDGVTAVLRITGLEKGNINLIVKDDVTNETERISVKVTDSYLVYIVDESKHPSLPNGTIMYLINNEAKDCYFFTYNYIKHEVYSDFITKGSYSFSVEKNSDPNLSYETLPYLTLTYKTDENDILTDENVPAKEHKFNLIGSSALTYTAINKFLGVDWDELAKTHSLRSESIVTFMKMQEDGTNYLLHGEITQFPQIPEGVLK